MTNDTNTAVAARHCEVQAAREYTRKLGLMSAVDSPDTTEAELDRLETLFTN